MVLFKVYFPSINKLKQKLDFKFGPKSERGEKYGGIFEADINFIISEKLINILVEKEIITSTINNYINKGKNLFYIKSKLAEKMFIKEDYEEILVKDFDIENSSLLNADKIYKQIKTLYKKNKSKNYIRNKFVENSFDAEIVDELLLDLFSDGQKEIIQNELEKIIRKKQGFAILYGDNTQYEYLQNLSFTEKQKIMQKLVGKGFGFGEIKEVMEDEK
ncbi:MAG: RecX family transcriptional regulator [Candidatus Gracilibacteria bacterium]|nr:RecX family transcriptional regulator [Candidatus Gracilibacteria bacterium]